MDDEYWLYCWATDVYHAVAEGSFIKIAKLFELTKNIGRDEVLDELQKYRDTVEKKLVQ